MADLCTAFKRIVPRYHFTQNQATFTIEDMNDSPISQRNGGFIYRAPNRTFGNKGDRYCSRMDTYCGHSNRL